MTPSPTPPATFHVSNLAHLWHLRLGHISPSRLKIVSPLLPLPNVHFLNNDCNVCPMAKQTRVPFSNSSISTHFPFDLIHCDIWGPHKTPTHSGDRFFLTIVDDFTRCTWVFLMKFKSETSSILEKFINFVNTQFHTTVKAIRIDNGSEFSPLHPFLSQHGIEIQRTSFIPLNRMGWWNVNIATF